MDQRSAPAASRHLACRAGAFRNADTSPDIVFYAQPGLVTRIGDGDIYHAPWLHAIVAPLILDWLHKSDMPNFVAESSMTEKKGQRRSR